MFSWLRQWGQAPEDGILLGHGRFYSEPRDTRRAIILPDRMENKHAAIFGRSGFGKSRFLYSVILQKIRAGESVILFDSHDGWKHILDALGQEMPLDQITDRLCLINPTEVASGVIGMNLLQLDGDQEAFGVVEELVSGFKSVFAEGGGWGDRLADVLRHSCYTLIENECTLLALPRLLSDDGFRRQAVQRLKSVETKLFWEHHFGGLRRSEQRMIVESARNKISAFVSNPFVRLMIGQRQSTMSFARIMNHPRGGIGIVHLSRNRLKSDQQRLLGALIFARLYVDILRREDLPESQRCPVNIYVEESSEIYNSDSVLNILSGARKLGVRLWLCFQSISQISQRDIDLILNGAAVNVLFCCEREEAKRLLGIFSFSGTHVKHEERDFWGPKGRPSYYSIQEEHENAIRELTNQRNRECYIRLLGADADEPYIAETPFVEYPPEDLARQQQLRALSAHYYAKPYEAAVREIEQQSFGARDSAGYNESERTGTERGAPQSPQDILSLFQN